MNNNFKKIIFVLTFIFVVGFVNRGEVNAASMSSFPTQKKGSYSVAYTRAVQVMLLHNKATCDRVRQSGGADGVFGSATEAAVKIYQKKVLYSDNCDGIVGSKTWQGFRNYLNKESTTGGYEYYQGTYKYNSSNLYKNTMRLKQSTQNWSCYYGKWYLVG